jgi:hypothetical protein
VFCVLGYGTGEHAPGWTDLGYNPYFCTHNVLKAHARAYRRYEQDYLATQNGQQLIWNAIYSCDKTFVGIHVIKLVCFVDAI